MEERSTDKELWYQLKMETDPMKAIHLIADLGYGAVVSRKRDVAKLELEISAIKKVVLGNGDPENSIIMRVARLCEDQRTLMKDISEVKTLIIGDIQKGVTNESILSKLQELVRVQERMNKITWVIVTAIVLEIITRIAGLF